MRTKNLSYYECAQLWAYQSQDQGETTGSRVFFYGPTIYSYGYHFIIAKYISDDVVFFNSSRYSNTTSKQQWIVRAEIPVHKTIFSVPAIPNGEPTWSNCHNKNVGHYVETILGLRGKQSRARKLDYSGGINRTLGEYQRYVDHFRLRSRLNTLQRSIFDENLDRADQEINKREVKKRKWSEEQKKKAKKQVSDWLKGLSSSLPYSVITSFGHDLIRYNEITKDLETSRGSRVKASDAQSLYLALDRGLNITGKHVGPFRIGDITSTKVVVGCHTFLRSDIDNIAKKLNWR